MPDLVLGPLPRHVGAADVTVRVETDPACEVEVLGYSSSTFGVGNHHYALVHVAGLEPGIFREYEVHLGGDRVWPGDGSPFPPSVIRPRRDGESARLVLGSCRGSHPREPQHAAWNGDVAIVGRLLAGAKPPCIGWRLAHDEPFFENQTATLDLDGRRAAITFEKAVLDPSKEPGLEELYRRRLI